MVGGVSKRIRTRLPWKRGWVFPFVFPFLVYFLMSCSPLLAAKSPPSSGVVKAVFDGDTILLETRERIRYLGIDAPEAAHDTEPADCMGEEATRFNSKLVLSKKVFLHYDRERRDVHDRILAYVHLADGRCVNAELLRGGYAYVRRTKEGFARQGEFLAIQREAIRARRGLWGKCGGTPAREYLGNRNTFVLHIPGCCFGQKIDVRNRLGFSSRWEAFEQGYRPCRRCKP